MLASWATIRDIINIINLLSTTLQIISKYFIKSVCLTKQPKVDSQFP